jgi:hypothetical protein
MDSIENGIPLFSIMLFNGKIIQCIQRLAMVNLVGKASVSELSNHWFESDWGHHHDLSAMKRTVK